MRRVKRPLEMFVDSGSVRLLETLLTVMELTGISTTKTGRNLNSREMDKYDFLFTKEICFKILFQNGSSIF